MFLKRPQLLGGGDGVTYFFVSPWKLGKIPTHFHEHMFQMGCFNHQLDFLQSFLDLECFLLLFVVVGWIASPTKSRTCIRCLGLRDVTFHFLLKTQWYVKRWFWGETTQSFLGRIDDVLIRLSYFSMYTVSAPNVCIVLLACCWKGSDL